MNSVLIIGGGLGGLFTGAILAKEGLHVTVVEKNVTIGGGLQSFRRFGETFDTGMHIIGGMQPGGNIWKLCRYLGIADKVEIREVDSHCTDSLYFAEDKCRYALAKGYDGFVDSLTRYFPEEREGLRQYVVAIDRIAHEIDLFFLRPFHPGIPQHSEEFVMSAEQLIARYITHPKLRSVLAFKNPLYGGGPQTPAYVHAVISVLYLHGTARFVEGSYRFADLLAGVITGHGGTILRGEKVTSIRVEDRKVMEVVTERGRHLLADLYVSAIHPCAMLPLVGEHAFPKSYRNRLNSIPNSYSAFSLFLKLKPGTFRYINHSVFYMTRYDEIWHFGDSDKPWPLGLLFMTPPKQEQKAYADCALITAPMRFDAVRQWEETTVGKRGKEYRIWKEECTRKLLEKVEEMFPGFGGCVEKVNSASPLTIRDFYGSKEGCLSGFSKDCSNLALSQLPVVTKISNLFLTGQNNNLHGFCGVPLTAIMTSEAILGTNTVIQKIRQTTPE